MAIWWFGVEIYAMVVLFGSIYYFAYWFALGWVGPLALVAFVALNAFLICKTYHYNNTLARYGLACLMLAFGVLVLGLVGRLWDDFLAQVYQVGAGLYMIAAALRLATLSRARLAASMEKEEPTF